LPHCAKNQKLAFEGIRSVKVREIIKMLEEDGWYRVKAKGGHRQYKHPSKPGRVTISGKSGDHLATGTLNSIFKQAGFVEQDLKEVH
jgi:predicted RNA binding protein YcfA (HicA-like mRNA interferase family)